MKNPCTAALLVALTGGVGALGGCASDAPVPVYAGTASGIGTGIVRPGQNIVVARGQTASGMFGQPDPVGETIRPPQAQVPAGALFNPAAGFDEPPDSSGSDAAGFDFAQALTVNPFDPVALNNLAVAKADQGEFQEAMALFERAARLAPDNAEVAANLARLRGYVQSYAAAGVAPVVVPGAVSSARLPPEPPPLWTGKSDRLPPVKPAAVLSVPGAGADYQSAACRRPAAKANPSTADTACLPAR